MIPKFASIDRVIVVSEHVIGPMQNSLLVRLKDGSTVDLQKKSDILSLVEEIRLQRPELASAPEERLAFIPDHAVEAVFTVDERHGQ